MSTEPRPPAALTFGTSRRRPTLVVDRIACTGRGICASLLPNDVSLDEWGYPVVHAGKVDPELGDIAVRLCPARALSLRSPS
ncbi:MAG: ferredoxin [Lapillicoccus sp.]